MGRTPALSLRLQGLVNWPSNVRHPFISKYVKHLFQHHVVSEPGIRASTTGIWVNVTVLAQPLHPIHGTSHKSETNQAPIDIRAHPKVQNPILDFSRVKLENALGPMEQRIKALLSGQIIDKKTGETTVVKEGHYYFKPLAKGAPSSLLEANGCEQDPLKALQIYRNTPIHLKMNIIWNPLLDAQVLADYVARTLKENDRALPRIYKQLLNSISE